VSHRRPLAGPIIVAASVVIGGLMSGRRGVSFRFDNDGPHPRQRSELAGEPVAGTGAAPVAPGNVGGGSPGRILPFGMIQWSPDTAPDRTDGSATPTPIRISTDLASPIWSGTGCASYGDIPVLPDGGAHREQPRECQRLLLPRPRAGIAGALPGGTGSFLEGHGRVGCDDENGVVPFHFSGQRSLPTSFQSVGERQWGEPLQFPGDRQRTRSAVR